MRFRSIVPLLVFALAAAVPAAASAAPQEDSVVPVRAVFEAPAPITLSVLRLDSMPVFSLEVARNQHTPTPTKHRVPIEMLAFAGAASRKKAPAARRKRSGFKVPDVPMYLDSTVHVMRDGELVVIEGGVLLDDTDLDDEEIAEISKHGVVRPATPAELERLQEAESLAEATALAGEQQQELERLRAAHEQKLAGAESDVERAELEEKYLADVQALQTKHAKALNS